MLCECCRLNLIVSRQLNDCICILLMNSIDDFTVRELSVENIVNFSSALCNGSLCDPKNGTSSWSQRLLIFDFSSFPPTSFCVF